MSGLTSLPLSLPKLLPKQTHVAGIGRTWRPAMIVLGSSSGDSRSLDFPNAVCPALSGSECQSGVFLINGLLLKSPKINLTTQSTDAQSALMEWSKNSFSHTFYLIDSHNSRLASRVRSSRWAWKNRFISEPFSRCWACKTLRVCVKNRED